MARSRTPSQAGPIAMTRAEIRCRTPGGTPRGSPALAGETSSVGTLVRRPTAGPPTGTPVRDHAG